MTKHFAVLGSHPKLSLAELELVHPQNIVRRGPLVFFETDSPELLSELAGLIKWGKVITPAEIEQLL